MKYKFLDKINEFIHKKKHTYKNIELDNNFITNTNTKEKNYLTQAENLILFKLFSEKNVNKKLLERDVLDIKQDLNTSSIESHLNRIRKKLKKIEIENLQIRITNHQKGVNENEMVKQAGFVGSCQH